MKNYLSQPIRFLASLSKDRLAMRWYAKFPDLGILLVPFLLVGTHSAPASASACIGVCSAAITVEQVLDARLRSEVVTKTQDEVRFDQLSLPGFETSFPGWIFGAAAQIPAGSVRATARVRPEDGAVGAVLVSARSINETVLNIGGATNGQSVRFSLDLALDGELDIFSLSEPFKGGSNIGYRLQPSNVKFVSGTEFASGPSGSSTRDAFLSATFSATAPGNYLSSFHFIFDWVGGTPAPVLVQSLFAEARMNGLANFFGTGKVTGVTLPAGLSLSADGLNFNELAPGQFAVIYAPVPIPGAIWFFGTALLGLVALRRPRSLSI